MLWDDSQLLYRAYTYEHDSDRSGRIVVGVSMAEILVEPAGACKLRVQLNPIDGYSP